MFNANNYSIELIPDSGIPVPHLSGMENDKRRIGKATAKKLAQAFATDFRRFL